MDIKDLKLLAMGTFSGSVLLYSVTKGNLHRDMCYGHSDVVNEVCWHAETDSVFSCSNDQYIVRWKISSGEVNEKWKADHAPIKAICVIDEKSIISASTEIKWWDLVKKTVIKRISAHASTVFSLLAINTALENSTEQYFISAAVGDKIIRTWRLQADECTTVASFSVPDDPGSLSLTHTSSKDQTISLSVITKAGDLHIFEHQLNGSTKPIEPKVTFQIIDSNLRYKKPRVIPVLAARISACGEICQMAYGNFLHPVFENKELKDCENHEFLLRPGHTDSYSSSEESVSKIKEQSKDGAKRKRSPKEEELTLEERMNAMYVDKTSEDAQQTAKSVSVTGWLLEGLQTQDQELLNKALKCRNEEKIRNAIKKLPVVSLLPFLKELCERLLKQEPQNRSCLKWLRVLLEEHLRYLQTCPDIDEYFGPLNQMFEAATQNYDRLCKLDYLLKTALDEADSRVKNESQTRCEALVTYRDDSSEEESEHSSPEDL